MRNRPFETVGWFWLVLEWLIPVLVVVAIVLAYVMALEAPVDGSPPLLWSAGLTLLAGFFGVRGVLVRAR